MACWRRSSAFLAARISSHTLMSDTRCTADTIWLLVSRVSPSSAGRGGGAGGWAALAAGAAVGESVAAGDCRAAVAGQVVITTRYHQATYVHVRLDLVPTSLYLPRLYDPPPSTIQLPLQAPCQPAPHLPTSQSPLLPPAPHQSRPHGKVHVQRLHRQSLSPLPLALWGATQRP